MAWIDTCGDDECQFINVATIESQCELELETAVASDGSFLPPQWYPRYPIRGDRDFSG